MRRIFIWVATIVWILMVTVVPANAEYWTRVKLLTCPKFVKATAKVTIKTGKGKLLRTAEITCGDRKHTFKTGGTKPRLWEATITFTNTQTGATETCTFSGRFKAGVRCGSPSVGLVLEKPFKKSTLQGHFSSRNRSPGVVNRAGST